MSEKNHIRIGAVKKLTEATVKDPIYIPSTEELILCQNKDTYCLDWINFIKSETKPSFSEIHLNKFKEAIIINDMGVLVLRPREGLRLKSDMKELIILPLSLFKYVAQSSHNYLMHPGIDKTYYIIKQRYFRAGLKALIITYIKQCNTCPNKKGRNTAKKTPIQKRPGPIEPFSVWSMDIVGPYTLSENGNKYILTMICEFSKWIECVPLPHTKAPLIAEKFLEYIVCRFGKPERIHSDRGSNFMSTIMKSLCTALGIKKTATTAYRPQANGGIERMHASLGNSLRLITPVEIER